jgi:hypothetical protein
MISKEQKVTYEIMIPNVNLNELKTKLESLIEYIEFRHNKCGTIEDNCIDFGSWEYQTHDPENVNLQMIRESYY